MARAKAQTAEAVGTPVVVDERRDNLPARTNPSSVIEVAIRTGASPETLEKMMALQERWEANEAKKAFDQAFSAMRNELPKIVKDREVDYTSTKGRTQYRYEDLHTLIEQVTPVLSKFGFSFRWRTKSDPNWIEVVCVLSHSMGHAEETSLSAAPDNSGGKNPIQAVGSGTAYLQRYTLKAILGVAAGFDDDGQSAGDRRPPNPTPAKDPTPQSTEGPLRAEVADTHGKSLDEIKAKINAEINEFMDKEKIPDEEYGTILKKSSAYDAYTRKSDGAEIQAYGGTITLHEINSLGHARATLGKFRKLQKEVEANRAKKEQQAAQKKTGGDKAKKK